MNKEAWIKANTPSALYQLSDWKRQEMISKQYDDYIGSMVLKIEENASSFVSQKRDKLINQLPDNYEIKTEAMFAINKCIDISPLFGTKYMKDAHVLRMVIQYSPYYNLQISKCADMVSIDNHELRDLIEILYNLSFDLNKIDYTQIPYASTLRTIIALIKGDFWYDKLLPFLYRKHTGYALKGISKILQVDGDVDWIVPGTSDEALGDLYEIIDKLGNLPACLKLPRLSDKDIAFFKKYGFKKENQDVMLKCNLNIFRELAIKYPSHITEISNLDSICNESLIEYAYKLVLTHFYSKADFEALPIETRCKMYSDVVEGFYRRYGGDNADLCHWNIIQATVNKY